MPHRAATPTMNGAVSKLARCAIYTRKSTEHNLDLAFNSLDAQREACEAYIKSQAHEGWRAIPGRYDDGAFSGASLDRPAMQKLLADVRAVTRSLADFAKLIELFDAHDVSFVSVTQSFNTSSSMGRLTLNVLLSFAQFERERQHSQNESDSCPPGNRKIIPPPVLPLLRCCRLTLCFCLVDAQGLEPWTRSLRVTPPTGAPN
jgi:hypothetical protein